MCCYVASQVSCNNMLQDNPMFQCYATKTFGHSELNLNLNTGQAAPLIHKSQKDNNKLSTYIAS